MLILRRCQRLRHNTYFITVGWVIVSCYHTFAYFVFLVWNIIGSSENSYFDTLIYALGDTVYRACLQIFSWLLFILYFLQNKLYFLMSMNLDIDRLINVILNLNRSLCYIPHSAKLKKKRRSSKLNRHLTDGLLDANGTILKDCDSGKR